MALPNTVPPFYAMNHAITGIARFFTKPGMIVTVLVDKTFHL